MESKAVLFDEIGGPEVLRLEKVALADPGAGEVLVRIDAIGLNRAEALFRSGGYWYDATLPGSRLGAEAAGEVVALGPEVDGFAPGDAVSVLATGTGMSHAGVYGDHVVVPATTLLRRPADMDAVTGAAVWLSYLTAYGALVEVGRIAPGDHVVITAASSSVGVAAIQIVTALGGVPVAVTRTEAKADRLRAVGAAHVVVADGGPELVAKVREVTGDAGARIVFDPVAGPGLADLATLVARGGVLIVYGWLDPRPAPLPMNWPLNVWGYALSALVADPEALRRGQDFVHAGLRAGTLAPLIDRTFDLEEIVDAHRHMEANGQVGKIVVTVRH
ncbi:zinc-dependent alcohol dehydrogenase family protein [Kitasatospora sp. SUK 42]|uniref:zinc-dependent alcohol dehydrogenase family protein n=1 Tax=Kitasatospora sp. SUK 42 TaxID=1588882 RepID=UPI0018C8EFD1|nr:zinc-dependent alcohol dehydrogenase family protein [Kitasatospora sp. SUK 42]MBV2152895.1 zinc-dependent alcohol dehydrogenase family protein [Kitasatospora sp. SUK 42]